jgi:hypothetical protein
VDGHILAPNHFELLFIPSIAALHDKFLGENIG